jgi:hypothetical protein
MNRIQPPVRRGRAGHHVRPDGHEFPEDVLDSRGFPANAAVGILRGQRQPLRRPNDCVHLPGQLQGT